MNSASQIWCIDQLFQEMSAQDWITDWNKNNLLEILEQKECFGIEKKEFLHEVFEALYWIDLSEISQDENDFNHYLSENLIFAKDYKMINFAYDFARLWHASQKRDSWEFFFNHPKDTALIMIREFGSPISLVDIILWLLHDVWEDVLRKSLNDQQIFWLLQYLFWEWIAYSVSLLTKSSDKIEKDWWKVSQMLRIAKDKKYYSKLNILLKWFDNAKADFKILMLGIIKTKIADRIDNLRKMESKDDEFVARKIKETRTHLLPIAKRYFPLGYRLLVQEIVNLEANRLKKKL